MQTTNNNAAQTINASIVWKWLMGLPSGFQYALQVPNDGILNNIPLGRNKYEAGKAVSEINERRKGLGLPIINAAFR